MIYTLHETEPGCFEFSSTVSLMPVSAVCAVSLVLAIPTMLCYQTLAGDW